MGSNPATQTKSLRPRLNRRGFFVLAVGSEPVLSDPEPQALIWASLGKEELGCHKIKRTSKTISPARFAASHPNTAQFAEARSMPNRNAWRYLLKISVKTDQYAFLLLGYRSNDGVGGPRRHVLPDELCLVAMLLEHIGHIGGDVFVEHEVHWPQLWPIKRSARVLLRVQVQHRYQPLSASDIAEGSDPWSNRPLRNGGSLR